MPQSSKRVCPEYTSKIVLASCKLHNIACFVDRVKILVRHNQVVLDGVFEEVNDDDRGIFWRMRM